MAAAPNHLASERLKLVFKPSDVTAILYGPAKAKQLVQDWNRMAQDDVLKNSPELYAMSRPELLTEMYKKSARLLQMFDLYKEDNDRYILDVCYHFQYTLPLATHWAMFRKAIEMLGTTRQCDKWLTQIRENKIFGAYAQTELGHGSDVRNLETTATFDKSTQEFIITTPRLSATKFWVGTLGLTATHCVLFAQLISGGNNYGVHPFIVQVRSIQTHLPLKGVTVGEIGPKLGYHGMDNGYLQLHNVRVPLDNLLCRFGRIRKDGTYYSPPFASMRYFVMMNVRVTLISEAAHFLAKAVTIATRYSLVREGPGHVLLLDYQLHQYKLFSVLANTYAMFSTSLLINKMHSEMVTRIREGDLSYVKGMHALTSGLKALFSSTTLRDIEVCRQSCGGHGFSEYSGLPAIYMDYAPTVTYEGDNTVLLLQCGSFLFKQLQKAKEGRHLSGWMEYLNYTSDYVAHRCMSKSISDFLNVLIYEEALRVRSAFLCKRLYEKITHDISEGHPLMDIMNERAQVDLIEAAKAHCTLFTYLEFKQFAQRQKGKIRYILQNLSIIFGAVAVKEGAAALYECGFFSNGTFEGFLDEALERVLTEIRPHAIGLVDAFAYTDNALNSAIGSYNGQPYETLFDWASNRNPFNKIPKLEAFTKFIQPNLAPKL